MKRGFAATFTSLGFMLATYAFAPVHAQTTAPGPYYATPSWDQTLPSTTRFVVLSNMNSQAVLDRETGFVWERTPSTDPRSWGGALQFCITRTTGGRMGWRLPSIHELRSLADPSNFRGDPDLPAGHPFIGITGEFWSATTNHGTDSVAYLTDFDI